MIAKLFENYRNTKVNPGVNIEIADGEFVVLVGPSECRKSTHLWMISGLEVVASGIVRISDLVVYGLSPVESDIALVFRIYAL